MHEIPPAIERETIRITALAFIMALLLMKSSVMSGLMIGAGDAGCQ